ncbi:MAG: Crp/Fnr family transcriptional regulator [Flavobacteriales bacterium]|nr:Crp/Fnr family transcriptional regulator [Flavobacteriales bacterium]
MSEKLLAPSCATCGARDASVFCNLDANQLADLDQQKSGGLYKKGEVIFNEGCNSRGLFCVFDGKVKLSMMGPSGKEQIVRFAQKGDVMGYNSMLSRSPLSATATVLEDAQVCLVPARYFFELIKKEPKFSLELLELTAKNWNQASRLITDMAQKTTKERLAEMLLWLKETFGLDEEDCIDVKLSREEIANMVGTATEAVIRLLSELKKEKLIELQGKRIRLLDIHGLVVLANLID